MISNNLAKIVDQNYLSFDECKDIEDKVLSLRNHWQECSINNFNFLPYGMYSVPITVYKDNVLKYKSLMHDNFSVYYEKISKTLNNIFDIPIEYHEKLNYPGFHISKIVSMNSVNFHTDGFPKLHTLINGKEKIDFFEPKIHSFIIPISLPDSGSGLLIRNNYDQDRHLLKYNDVLEYKLGMLAMWDGNLQHAVKPFSLGESDKKRITLQFHVANNNKKGYVFW